MTTMNELFAAGAKPKRTLIPTGTGTFVPSVDNALCRVRLQAGGGGGWNALGTAGGGGGAMVEFWIRIPIAGLPYVVGAGGAVLADGSKTTLGPISALPGKAAVASSQPGDGGILGAFSGSVDADSVSVMFGGALDGVSGGSGGYSTNGQMIGSPVAVNSPYATNPGSGAFAESSVRMSNGRGVASGGDSFYGKGAVNGSAPGATDYGAGGGGNAAGLGGCIEIEDFGA